MKLFCIFLLICIFLPNANAQLRKYPFGKFEISEGVEFAFTKKNKEFKMAYGPVIVVNGQIKPITGYDGDSGPGSYLSISPNKKFIIIEAIIIGYVEDGRGNKRLHENYMCDLVDVETRQVIDSWQGGCAGEWNENNQFIYADEIYFDANTYVPAPSK